MEKRLVASDTSKYKIVRKNWFAYNPMRLNIGSIARWHGANEILVSPDYVVFRCLEESKDDALSANYLDHFRHSDQWDAFVTEAGDGGVRVRIYYDDISQLQLTLPDIAEQQKIADCLGSLDDLIAAEGRKLEALREHKQGLMQQLFPQPGEAQPHLRFPEFKGGSPWKETPLTDHFAHIRNGFVGTATPHYVDNGVPYLQGKNIKGGRIDPSGLVSVSEEFHKRQAKSQLQMTDIVMVQSGHIGECAIVGTDYAGSNCHALIVLSQRYNCCSPFFVNYFYSPHGKGLIAQAATGNTIRHILASDVRVFRVPVPELDERRRIADCLASLDARLAAQAQRLIALKQHKQALLQQLFPAAEGNAL